MTRKETARRYKVMKAYVNGAQIECRNLDPQTGWKAIETPSWNWPSCDYRVKLPPREGWVRITDLHRHVDFCDGNCIHVREVEDDANGF